MITPLELKEALQTLGCSPERFSQIICAHDKSTVYNWLNGRRAVPGYACAFIELLLNCEAARKYFKLTKKE